MPENRLIDSNIIVYAFDRSEGGKHEKAKAIISLCLDKKETFFISLQNISEFYNIVTTKIEKPLSKQEARKICYDLSRFSGFVKLVPNAQTLIEAMHLNEKYDLDYWDALIAATMRENHVSAIITENLKDFNKVPGINAVNPFIK